MKKMTFRSLALGLAALALAALVAGCASATSDNGGGTTPTANYGNLFVDKSLTTGSLSDAAAKGMLAIGDYNGTLTVEPTLDGVLRATVGAAAATSGWSAGTLAQVSDAAINYGSYFDFTNVKKITFKVRGTIPLGNIKFKMEDVAGGNPVPETAIGTLDSTVTTISDTTWTPVTVDLTSNTAFKVKLAFCFVLGTTAGYAEYKDVAFVDGTGANVNIAATVSYTTVNNNSPYITEKKTSLTTAITAATTLANGKTIGTANGNYAQATVDTYKAAIATAQTVALGTTATRSDIDAAIATLATATANFNKGYVGYVSPTVPANIFNADGSAADVTTTLDNWGSGTTFNSAATDTTYAHVIDLTSSTGWGFCVAFMGLNQGFPGDYSTLKFKVKSAAATDVKVSIPGFATQDVVSLLSTGTAIGSTGWVQMSVPISGHGAVTSQSAAVQFALIFSVAAKVTDIQFVP